MKAKWMGRVLTLGVVLGMLGLAGCRDQTDDAGDKRGRLAAGAADCADFLSEPFVTRTDLAPGERKPQARLLLRFWHFTDDHIIDDDGQAINGLSFVDPLHPALDSAMRLQEEYSDEVLNDLIERVNDCHARHPAEFMIVTGDSADLTTISETRRFIDNLDGTFDRVSAFEKACVARLPAGTPAPVIDQECTRFTGRGVADTQAIDPDPDSRAYQFNWTRTLAQMAATEQAAISGRAADGSMDPRRQTATRSPGLPEVLRCTQGEAGCANTRLAMPWYVAFGNHDGYPRGTIPFGTGVNELSKTTGRYYMLNQHEFIDEFFETEPVPGPVGHGFNFVERERWDDGDPRNDGYYAFDAGRGKFRMIVLNTIYDGLDPRLPDERLRNIFGLERGTLDRAQFEWLQRELARAWDRKQLVFAFSHHPDVSFIEYGEFGSGVRVQVTAAQLNAELASWPHVLAWVAGHTHRHRIRPFKVANGRGSNGSIETEVQCKKSGCTGFWQIETASLIDHPQQQRLIEVWHNGDGGSQRPATGVIRGPIIGHRYEKAQKLAAADDRCSLYLSDPVAVVHRLTEAGLDGLCRDGGTREGRPEDRNVELVFRVPQW